MIDIDIPKLEVDETDVLNSSETATDTTYIRRGQEKYLNFLIEYCQNNPDLLFKVYLTRKGLHVFLVSHHKLFTDDNSIQLMLNLKCDFYYIDP